jgi:ppGpp synthetase/RelA/SpoT-type nucleotidyltranferase
MTEKEQLTLAKHRKQIEAYRKEFDFYKTYAEVLRRVLAIACATSFPEALVQSRPKSISSFAEKVARKFDKYPDAVNQMTDLCGARVIVQTTEQVKAVRQFIEANFAILEKEDKGLLLSEDEFGYRDMHYIVELRPERTAALGISPDECETIGGRRAEVQVRTWVQHAWADTLHDRMYKNKLKISPDVVRTGALLAALMEEGDRTFNQLAEELDGLIANYTAFASKTEVEKEIEIQELILGNESDENKKPAMALKLARLVAACGDDARVVELLTPHAGIRDANRCELLLDLGYALCRLHRSVPSSPEYRDGRSSLEESLRVCECTEVPFVPHLRKHESLHARALARLGWALEAILGEEEDARKHYQRAHEHEPANPYYLANMLGFEMYTTRGSDLPAAMRTTIREAIKTCRKHAVAGMELPYAYFTAGRLSLLVERAADALRYYARGIRHCLARTHRISRDAFAGEIDWIKRVHFGVKIPPASARVIELLTLAQQIECGGKPSGSGSPLSPPVLIVAGGAASVDAATAKSIRPLLATGLADIRGTVVSGGTTAGVPGCVGDVAGELSRQNRKHFQLVGYLPVKLPHGVSADKHYDAVVAIGDDFSPDQILRNWSDILVSGIDPAKVLLLGIGGGPLSAVEYCIALGLGASVGIVTGMPGAGADLLNDELWAGLPNLYPLPFDPTTVRAFLIPSQHQFDPAVQELMAQSFHRQFVAGSTGRLPNNMRPWPKLADTFKKANLEQAKYSVEILAAAGFGVRAVDGNSTIFTDFTAEDVERMAEMEHGRWNVERLRDGWRFGSPRDDSRQIHNCLVSWSELPETIKHYDRDAVRAFPEILAKAGLEIYRLR